MVACQFGVCLTMIIFLQWSQPLESRFSNNLETFNECTTILILYTVLCFSDFVDSSLTRSKVGLVFVGIISFNVLVHILNLAVGLMCLSRLRVRTAWHNFRVKEELEIRAIKQAELEKDPEYLRKKKDAEEWKQLNAIMEESDEFSDSNIV